MEKQISANKQPEAFAPSGAKSRARAQESPHPIDRLHSLIGNRAVGQFIQAKLQISQPGDQYEQETDNVADQVMRMPDPASPAPAASVGEGVRIQRICQECEEEMQKKETIEEPLPEAVEEPVLRAEEAPGPVAAGPCLESRVNALYGVGEPLPVPVRDFFEPRFGYDFSGVRLHTDAGAAELARDTQALAFTVGRDVVFGAGQLSPDTESGRRLLAHELTHVVQQSKRGTEPTVQRQPKTTQAANQNVTSVSVYCSDDILTSSYIVFSTPGKDYTYKLNTCSIPEGSYDTTVTVTGGTVKWDFGKSVLEGQEYEFGFKVEPGQENPATLFKGQKQVHIDVTKLTAVSGQQGYRVEIITADDYLAATGRSLASLPDRRMVSPDEAGFSEQVNSPNWAPGVGVALVLPTRPAFPLPRNATGLLWAGGHASDFAIVEGDIFLRGFRADLWRHGLSDLERSTLGRLLLGRGGGPATTSLNRGVPGFWANDWLFPYFADATAVYPDKPLSAQEAAAFAEFLNSRGAQYAGKEYRFSPPPSDHPAWQRAFGDTPAGFCPPGAANCINLPLQEHQRALSGAKFEPGQPGPTTGRAADMGPWLEEPHPGLRTVRIGPAMRARLAAGVIKAGGVVLIVYGGVQTYERIKEATPEERPIVIGEEAGSWIGGWVGAVLSEALAGAFICAETGPGAFFCALGAGIVGGFGGSVVGHGIGHDVAEAGKLLGDTPRLIEATTIMFGSEEDRRKYYELREIETGESNPWAW